MLQVGDTLPKFTLPNQNEKMISSEDFSGQKLVVFFYPQASTPTCTVEVCNLRDHYAELQKQGFQLVGISADLPKKNNSFHVKHSLPFDLLCDPEHVVLNSFGVWQQKTTFGKTYMGIVRSTFIFDENGICMSVIDKVKSKIAAEQILEQL